MIITKYCILIPSLHDDQSLKFRFRGFATFDLINTRSILLHQRV